MNAPNFTGKYRGIYSEVFHWLGENVKLIQDYERKVRRVTISKTCPLWPD